MADRRRAEAGGGAKPADNAMPNAKAEAKSDQPAGSDSDLLRRMAERRRAEMGSGDATKPAQDGRKDDAARPNNPPPGRGDNPGRGGRQPI